MRRGITWNELRDLIDRLPESKRDQVAYVNSSADATDEDLGDSLIFDLVSDSKYGHPLIIIEN